MVVEGKMLKVQNKSTKVQLSAVSLKVTNRYELLEVWHT